MVRFGSFRGDADSGDGALGCVEVALDALVLARRTPPASRLPRRSGCRRLPGLAQTAGSRERSSAALARWQPGQSAALSSAGEAATPGNQSLPPGTFTAPSRIGATPVYGSPTGFGAGDTGFDSMNTPRRKKLAQTPPSSGGARAAARNDFRAGAELHVPRNVQTCRAEKAAGAGDPSDQGRDTDRRGLAAAARAAAVEQSAAGGTSVDGRQPPRRGLADPAAGIFRLRGEHPAADDAAAQYAAAGNGAAAAAADRRRRSLRGARHQGRLVPVAALARSVGRLQHQSGACDRRRRRSPISSPRRNCMSAPIGSATRSPPTSPAPIPIRRRTSCRRSTCRISMPRSTAASTSRAIPKSLLEGRSSSRPTIPAARTCRPASPSCRSTPTSAARSAWSQQFNRLSVSLKGTFDRADVRQFAADRRRDFGATPTATSTNMPASCASAMSSIPGSSRSWSWRKISASTTSSSIAATCSATRSARAAKSAPPSICSARSPARWRSAMSSASTRIRRCRISAA